MLWLSPKKRRDLPEGFVAPCVPTIAARPPAGPLWIHEIKQDGYRMIAKRGEGVRLLTRNGHDWTKRYQRIVAAIEGLPVKSAAIDGEALWLDDQGIGDFRKLHSRLVDREVTFFAFDLLELDGRDIRKEPLERRRELLRAIVKSADVVFSDCYEGDGAAFFATACRFGLEGIVSKRRDLAYESGKSNRWLKIKNPESPAMLRLRD